LRGGRWLLWLYPALPTLRAVCKTEHAVSVMTDWVRSNNLSFAVRCGGHSYEGFSQSKDARAHGHEFRVGIDTDIMQSSRVDNDVSLYDVYQGRV
jgi:FAD/FMN-containing dehydrogenase